MKQIMKNNIKKMNKNEKMGVPDMMEKSHII